MRKSLFLPWGISLNSSSSLLYLNLPDGIVIIEPVRSRLSSLFSCLMPKQISYYRVLLLDAIIAFGELSVL